MEAQRKESAVQFIYLNKMAYNFPRDCLEKIVKNPSYEAISLKISNGIQCMKDNAVIGKFMGIQLSEKELILWINSQWKCKGKEHFVSQGFFTCIQQEQRIQNMSSRTIPTSSTQYGFHLKFWIEKFNPEKKDSIVELVWI